MSNIILIHYWSTNQIEGCPYAHHQELDASKRQEVIETILNLGLNIQVRKMNYGWCIMIDKGNFVSK